MEGCAEGCRGARRAAEVHGGVCGGAWRGAQRCAEVHGGVCGGVHRGVPMGFLKNC